MWATVPAQAEKIQLFLGLFIDAADTATIRNAEPSLIMMPSFNATSQTDPTQVLPGDYYLYDVNGNKIQNWPTPGSYLLNLTKPEVATFLANEAYQYLVANNLAYDGIFWDNVYLSISWYTPDVFGNPVAISSQNNGIADDPATLDAAWARESSRHSRPSASSRRMPTCPATSARSARSRRTGRFQRRQPGVQRSTCRKAAALQFALEIKMNVQRGQNWASPWCSRRRSDRYGYGFNRSRRCCPPR